MVDAYQDLALGDEVDASVATRMVEESAKGSVIAALHTGW